jgi:adenine deaminase
MVVVEERGVRAELPLPVAGLLSDQPLPTVLEQSATLADAVAALGCSAHAPFHAMGFLALSVIPALKITDRGLVDVDAFEIVPLEV